MKVAKSGMAVFITPVLMLSNLADWINNQPGGGCGVKTSAAE